MSLFRAYLWTTSRVLLTRVAHQESKRWSGRAVPNMSTRHPRTWSPTSPRLSARLVNRDKDLIVTTDAHHRPGRVHAQRPGKGLQAKQNESLRAQDSAIQKPDQNRNNMSQFKYNHPYQPYSTSKMKIWQLWSRHLQSVSHDIPPISCRKIDR